MPDPGNSEPGPPEGSAGSARLGRPRKGRAGPRGACFKSPVPRKCAEPGAVLWGRGCRWGSPGRWGHTPGKGASAGWVRRMWSEGPGRGCAGWAQVQGGSVGRVRARGGSAGVGRGGARAAAGSPGRRRRAPCGRAGSGPGGGGRGPVLGAPPRAGTWGRRGGVARGLRRGARCAGAGWPPGRGGRALARGARVESAAGVKGSDPLGVAESPALGGAG